MHEFGMGPILGEDKVKSQINCVRTEMSMCGQIDMTSLKFIVIQRKHSATLAELKITFVN